MSLTTQQFRDNLLLALRKAAAKSEESPKPYKFAILLVSEPQAKHTSADDFLRLGLLQAENIAGRLFDLEEVTAFLSGPNCTYPLWIEVVPQVKSTDYTLVDLRISGRFRKPSALRYQETGHPPFNVVRR